MTKELKCPKCGSTKVDEDEIFDTDKCFGEYAELCVGTCLDCGARIRYDAVYKFVGFDNIEED